MTGIPDLRVALSRFRSFYKYFSVTKYFIEIHEFECGIIFAVESVLNYLYRDVLSWFTIPQIRLCGRCLMGLVSSIQTFLVNIFSKM